MPTNALSAAGISGVGGGNGQVLTNNGDGTVAWKALPAPPAVPVVIKAHIAGGGFVEFGPVTATRVSTGYYRVRFQRQLASCGFSAMVGAYNGGSWNNYASVKLSASSSSQDADVYLTRTDTGTDVYLNAFC